MSALVPLAMFSNVYMQLHLHNQMGTGHAHNGLHYLKQQIVIGSKLYNKINETSGTSIFVV